MICLARILLATLRDDPIVRSESSEENSCNNQFSKLNNVACMASSTLAKAGKSSPWVSALILDSKIASSRLSPRAKSRHSAKIELSKISSLGFCTSPSKGSPLAKDTAEYSSSELNSYGLPSEESLTVALCS